MCTVYKLKSNTKYFTAQIATLEFRHSILEKKGEPQKPNPETININWFDLGFFAVFRPLHSK